VAFVFADGSISTTGDDADGVDLQSVGGGGGKARATTSVDVEVSVVVGGDGGDGRVFRNRI